MDTEKNNNRILNLLGVFLVNRPDFISPDMVREMTDLGMTEEEAFSQLMAAAFGLDLEEKAEDRELYHSYFPEMIHKMDPTEYLNDPYYIFLKDKDIKKGHASLEQVTCKAYEAFVENDFRLYPDGRRIPQIGFFPEDFRYPAVMEDGRLWMSIAPNEINTMKEAMDRASGNVLVFGLGLGYFQYRVMQKQDVRSVTCVELNRDIIDLFSEQMLPFFPNREKLTLVCEDAFHYAEREFPAGKYDYVFTDLWHDVSDGLPMYLRMKGLEKLAPSGTVFDYWIEKTMKCYM